MKYGRLFVLSLVVACVATGPSPRVLSMATATDAAMPALEAQRAEIRDLIDQLQHLAIRGERGSTPCIGVFANARPTRLPRAFVRRVLSVQDQLDVLLRRYEASGGRLWCERPVVTAGHGTYLEMLRFEGLPRYHDVMRGTRCFVDDPGAFAPSRRPVEPFIVLDYGLGDGNDITGERYLTERYPVPPLPPVPDPLLLSRQAP